jgi:hypothetical protein
MGIGFSKVSLMSDGIQNDKFQKANNNFILTPIIRQLKMKMTLS